MKDFLLNLLRAYPRLILLFALITKDPFLFVGILIEEQINHFLKYIVVRPLLGDKKYPIMGSGARPKGARNCGVWADNKNVQPKSYGMPSGHSAAALFFSTYKILELMNNKSNNTALYFIYVLLALVIPYSRLYFKCHTIQQAIVGGIIGSILGYYWFKNKSNIYKFINYNITK